MITFCQRYQLLYLPIFVIQRFQRGNSNSNICKKITVLKRPHKIPCKNRPNSTHGHF